MSFKISLTDRKSRLSRGQHNTMCRRPWEINRWLSQGQRLWWPHRQYTQVQGHSLDENIRILTHCALGDVKSTSAAWCRQATSHYMNQCWPRSLSPYGITRPQWINGISIQEQWLSGDIIYRGIFHGFFMINLHYALKSLTHWGRDKMDTISQTTLLITFSWMKMLEFRLNFHWCFVPKGPINNIPALFQIMAWRRPGDKPLSGPMIVRLPTHICVTRPQWKTK